jgi:hypothetical protein
MTISSDAWRLQPTGRYRRGDHPDHGVATGCQRLDVTAFNPLGAELYVAKNREAAINEDTKGTEKFLKQQAR